MLAQADEDGWTLQRDEGGIKVFSRPQGEGLIDEFKGTVTVQGNIDSAFKVISDLPTFSGTDQMVSEATILHRENAHVYYVWERGNLPFFMQDRDIVSKVTLTETARGGYMMAFQAVPAYIPEKPGFVRVQSASLVVALHPLTPDSFELLYRGKVGDTNGKMMTTVGNKLTVESTYQRLKRLYDLVSVKPLAEN